MKRLLSAGPLGLSFLVCFCLGANTAGAEATNTPSPAGATSPPWPEPAAQPLSPKAASARSKDLEVLHSPAAPGAFDVRVAGDLMALGQSGPLIGYLAGGEMRWFNFASAADAKRTIKARGKSVGLSLEGRDADGAVWRIQQQFIPGHIPSAVDVRTEVSVDQDRAVAFLPMLMLFPGSTLCGLAKRSIA